MAHLTDVRIEWPPSFYWVGPLTEPFQRKMFKLVKIDLDPPAAGPEIELTFESPDVPSESDLEVLADRLLNLIGRQPLAVRTNSPSQGFDLEPPSWFARTKLGRKLFGE